MTLDASFEKRWPSISFHEPRNDVSVMISCLIVMCSMCADGIITSFGSLSSVRER